MTNIFKDKIVNRQSLIVNLKEGWLSLAFLLVALMAVVWSVQGAHWVPGTDILTTVALVAFAIGFVLARVRFVPGLLAHSFMLSVGMVAIGFLTFPYTDPRYIEWTGKLGSTVLRVVKWGEGAIAGRPQEDRLVALVGLSLITWVVSYFSAWLVFRRQRVWWALFLLGTVLIVNVSYNVPNAGISFLVWVVASLLLVIRVNAFKNEERWRRLRLAFQPNLARTSLLLGTLLILLIVLAAFAAPSSPKSPQLQAVLDQISSPFNSVRDNLLGTSSAGKDVRLGRMPVGYNAFGKSFTIGGPLNLSNDPVLRVKGDQVSYLQAAVLDEYDGKGWIATYQDAPNAKDLIFPQLSLAANQQLPTSPDKSRFNNQLQITPLQPNLPTFFLGGDPVSLDRTSLLAFHWEPVKVNAPIETLTVQQVGVGLDGKPRNLMVDTTNRNKPIPPDLLPLVNLLKTANREGGPVVPPSFTFYYLPEAKDTWFGSTNPNSISDPRVKRQADGTFTVVFGDWTYRIPAQSSIFVSNQTNNPNRRSLVQAFNKNNPDLLIDVPISRQNQTAANQFNITIDVGSTGTRMTREQFEQTATGKEVTTELDRLVKQIPTIPAKASYTFRNGRPIGISYDGYQPNYDDLLVVSALKPLSVGEQYTSNGLRFRGDVESLGKAGTEYPDWVAERYLKFPSTIPNRVKLLARQVSATGNNPYEKAKLLEDYLRNQNNFKYNPNVGTTPEGRDAVDYFLFDSKEGYCVHFSSAMVMMLRSIGIPAREVTGFAGGERDEANGTTLIRGTAAHAWAQAYFPGYGWVTFEATPAYNQIERPPNPAAVQPLPTPTPLPANNPATTSQTNAPSNTVSQPQEDPGKPAPSLVSANSNQNGFSLPAWLQLLLFLAGLGLLLYLLNTFWVLYATRLPDTSPRAVYLQLHKVAQFARLSPRREMTPYEYSAYLSKNLPGASKPIDTLVGYYVRDRYGPAANEPLANTDEVNQNWQATTNALLKYRRHQTLLRFTPRFMHGWINGFFEKPKQ